MLPSGLTTSKPPSMLASPLVLLSFTRFLQPHDNLNNNVHHVHCMFGRHQATAALKATVLCSSSGQCVGKFQGWCKWQLLTVPALLMLLLRQEGGLQCGWPFSHAHARLLPPAMEWNESMKHTQNIALQPLLPISTNQLLLLAKEPVQKNQYKMRKSAAAHTDLAARMRPHAGLKGLSNDSALAVRSCP